MDIQMIRPNPASNARGFVEYWQGENKFRYSLTKSPPIKHRNIVGKSAMTEDALSILLQLRRAIAESRKLLTLVLLKEELKNEPFEAKWAGLSRKEREQVLIKALVFICSHLNVEELWEYAPEVNLLGMCGQNGEGFLALIDHFKMNQVELNSSSMPLDFPVLKQDDVWRLHEINTDEEVIPLSQGERAIQNLVLVKRHRFLSLFVCHTLGTFYHLPASINYSNVTQTEITRNDQDTINVVKAINPALATAVESTRLDERCDQCGCPKSPSKKLFVCAKCKEDIGRFVWYCSRECQVKAYKSGTPPHKLICGKPLNSVDLVQSKSSSSPAPSSSTVQFNLYTTAPTPELRMQIFCLGQPDEPLQHYNFLKDGRRAPVTFQHSPVADLFLSMRLQAIGQQDLCAIGVMDLLLRTMGAPSIPGTATSVEDWTTQLEKEYQVDIWICRNKVMNTPGLFEFIQQTTDATFLEEAS